MEINRHSPLVHGSRAAPGWSLRGAGAVLLAASVLAGCGGGSGTAGTDAAPAPLSVSLTQPANSDPGLLLLLVPDGTAPGDQRVAAWIDAAQEVGVRLAAVTDSDFMAMGSTALKYGGLVLPDTIHAVATEPLIAAIRSYVNAGGNALLTYDFGAQFESGGNVFYAFGKSRLSDLAGVDYVLYDQLGGDMIGLGPITAMRSTMRVLQVPPGKSMPYTLASANATTTARFLSSTTTDPGGTTGFDFQQYSRVKLPTAQERSSHSIRSGGTLDWGKSKQGTVTISTTKQSPTTSAKPGKGGGGGGSGGSGGTLPPPAPGTPEPDVLDAYSGYFYGYLSYPSFVTSGTHPGTVLATSPLHGLAAAVNTVGSGKVLFVNLPLTYLKGQTDALPMHGFLSYFARQMGRVATLSPMPDGVAGMVFNWHLDAKNAQRPSLLLEQHGVFSNEHLFSIHMTAGPDTVTFGDGLGWNLPHNKTAQDLLKRLAATGHDVGSHGGWIHDYYGLYASESNQADFLQYLVLNRNAVDGVVKKPARSYAAPEGNNPNWAMSWLEQQGVVAAYFLGHTGLGVTRQYRDGVLKTPNLAVVPLTPMGTYATFEEFQDFNVPQQDVMDWHRWLVDFTIAQDTNRMIYAHPPGAYAWLNVLDNLLAYTKAKGPSTFRWYTMPQLADHMARRTQVNWSEDVANGFSVITASRTGGLDGMAWRLPKSAYQQPAVTTGTALVVDAGDFWLVKPSGSSVVLRAARS